MGSRSLFRALVIVTAILAFTAGSAVIEARSSGASSVAASRHAGPATTCTPGKRSCPITITFASGAYSGQASSHLHTINSQRWFQVGLQKNQEVVVWVIGAGPTRGVIYFPGGGQDGGPGGRIYDNQAPSTGNYRIQVTEDSMANEWSGKVTVLVVAI
jgi:hypothetical protein